MPIGYASIFQKALHLQPLQKQADAQVAKLVDALL